MKSDKNSEAQIELSKNIFFSAQKFKNNIILRTNHAIGKAYQADEAAELARDESKIARCVAKEMSPDYHQPGSYLYKS